MGDDRFAVRERPDEVGVDAVLLLESFACGGSDTELINGLCVFPCGDGSCEGHDGLGCGCAVGDDGAGCVEKGA